MIELTTLRNDMAWPLAILLAWIAGEFAYRWLKLSRISAYALVGFVLAPSQGGLLPASQSPTMLLMANIAFGLILFESGYRINLRWLRSNPWIAAASLTEAILTFASVYFLVLAFDQTETSALLLAALSMATSPATILRVINEQKSSGQVTERVLHLSVLNCVLAVLVFKVIVGLVIFKTSGNLWDASYNGLIVLIVSAALGLMFGVLIPAVLRKTKRLNQDGTLAFTIAVVFIVALTHSLKLSPVLATLTFGLVARHRRIILNASQRGFGALGDLLSVILFVFIAATIEWKQVVAGVGLGLAIIVVRQVAKMAGIGIYAKVSGISWRKGALIGMATMPISAFVILVLEQTRYIGVNLVDQLAPLATAALTLEILGPLFIQRALIWAHEVPENKED
ncbi:cation:proton antiporter [Undibacterium seohonense]|uniref:Cation:proton antiporter n=1 Tax=Undibacterium seohonense TaxID=1344950 RepID=A0ABR6X348_9BURK|nr:cation:proton antiporter [Undibacterium seohonense]MBC3806776.1 cation:proton antiporter [Undibacterium seohonense]